MICVRFIYLNDDFLAAVVHFIFIVIADFEFTDPAFVGIVDSDGIIHK